MKEIVEGLSGSVSVLW